MSTISYREIVRMVHPDLNPHIQDAGAKMAEIQQNKNNPSILFRLAARWGLVDGGDSHSHTDNTWSSFSEQARRNRERRQESRRNDFRADNRGNVTRLHKEDGVAVKFKGRMVFGKIKDIETVKKGKRRGWKKIAVALTNGKIVYVKKPEAVSDINLMKHENMMPESHARADETWNRYIQNKEEQKRAKEAAKERKAEDIKSDLGTNVNYRGRDVWAFVRTKGNWFRVTRTTAKSVFYLDWTGTERRCQFSSVIRVRKGE